MRDITREEFEHWEIDTVIGKRGAEPVLLTLDERKTRKRHIIKIASKTSEAVRAGLQQIIASYGDLDSLASLKRLHLITVMSFLL